MTETDRSSSTSGQQRPPPPTWRFLIWYALITLLMLWVWQEVLGRATLHTIPYSEFKARLARKEVTECTVRPDEIEGSAVPAPTPTPGKAEKPNATTAVGKPAPFLFRTIRVEDTKLVDDLQTAGVKFSGERPSFLSHLVWAWLLPIGIMLVLWVTLSNRIGSAQESVMGFGKSRAKLVAETETRVNFDDVAGCDEAKTELREVVDFLSHPEHYRSLGAKIPKGVLLVGPPGTGKTLLARAVAGEARVPFFLISGSDFVEMFVGVGAARVRDLFRQAKAQAPSIIFLDELDAIGRQRGVHVSAGNDEREQTLNQLLVEMDGFEANSGVIVLSATNRPDVLDQALLRPGRFDRQVIIDAPDLDGREEILKIHARDKPLADDVHLDRIAQATPGFSGADLANAMNEAALLAARRQASAVSQSDLEEAVEKVVAGPERRSRRLQEDVKRRVAYHEVGHALVAVHCRFSDPVQKISIIPRGRAALGYTLQRPERDRYIMTRSELVDRITGMMGGRAAEELVFGEPTTGAENDLERATALARQMVCLYGMSSAVGLTHCGQKSAPFLGEPVEEPFQRDCSEATARVIDGEVKTILDEAWQTAKGILAARRDELDRVAAELLRRETLDFGAFHALISEPNDAPTADLALAPYHPR